MGTRRRFAGAGDPNVWLPKELDRRGVTWRRGYISGVEGPTLYIDATRRDEVLSLFEGAGYYAIRPSLADGGESVGGVQSRAVPLIASWRVRGDHDAPVGQAPVLIVGPDRLAGGKLAHPVCLAFTLSAGVLVAVDALPGSFLHDSTVKFPVGQLRPIDVAEQTLDEVLGALSAQGVDARTVRKESTTRTSLAIMVDQVDLLVPALKALVDKGYYLRDMDGPEVPSYLTTQVLESLGEEVRSIRLWRYLADPDHGLIYGQAFACCVEVWRPSAAFPGLVEAPEPNAIGQAFSPAELEPVIDPATGRRTFATFSRRSVHEVDPDIDAVYLWVDSEDPQWQEEMRHHRAALGFDDHRSAHASRFRSRDELRYSLRSVAMYAPWIRRIFLVTAGQVPDFIDPSAPGMEMVHHSEILDAEHLPTFNSSAIISALHRIPGLGERFILFNDDVFLGRQVHPVDFFTAGGLPILNFSANRRPVASVDELDDTFMQMKAHQRELLDERIGRSLSRFVKHVPHALRRDTLEHLEVEFADELEATRRNRFRGPRDINLDHFHHYFSEATGRGVPRTNHYVYVNLGVSADEPKLEALLARRSRMFFCLNDSHVAGDPGISDDVIANFMDSYFPVRSPWERVT